MTVEKSRRRCRADHIVAARHRLRLSDCVAEFDYGTMVTLDRGDDCGLDLPGLVGAVYSGTGDCTLHGDAGRRRQPPRWAVTPARRHSSYTGALQTLALPHARRTVTIDASRTHRAAKPGGLGARIKGTLTLPKRTTLSVMVGGMGGIANGSNAGGGGGSFVYAQCERGEPVDRGRRWRRHGAPTRTARADPALSTAAPTNSINGSGNGAGWNGHERRRSRKPLHDAGGELRHPRNRCRRRRMDRQRRERNARP